MGCSACQEAARRAQALRREFSVTNNVSRPRVQASQNTCMIVKNYVLNVINKEIQFFKNKKRFGSSKDINLSQAPFLNLYTYSFSVIGDHYVLFRATPLDENLPTIVGYAYEYKHHNNTRDNVLSLVQISNRPNPTTNLITVDAPQTKRLTVENGWSLKC